MSATETQDRILERAWSIVAQEGITALTMQRVADEAGVSRQAVYLHFTSRAGLLTRMARWRDRTSGFADRVQAARKYGPVPALERLVHEWCAYIPQIYPVARELETAPPGTEGDVALSDRMADLLRIFGAAVERVAQAGLLADGWTVDLAADWVYAQTHLSAWSRLVVERGWSETEFAERVTAALRRELLGPGC